MITSLKSTLTLESHISDAVKVGTGSTFSEHWNTISAGIESKVGSVVSSIMKDAYPTSVFPQASVAVNSYTCSLAPPQSEMVLNNILVTTTGQTSVPDAVPSHVANAAVFPRPSHSTVISAGAITSGSILSG